MELYGRKLSFSWMLSRASWVAFEHRKDMHTYLARDSVLPNAVLSILRQVKERALSKATCQTIACRRSAKH